MLKIPSSLPADVEQLMHDTIGCCIAVHRALGPGLIEKIYTRGVCVELTAAGLHLTPRGLIQIAEIAQTMNRQKPRHELIRILRGHTPDIQDTG